MKFNIFQRRQPCFGIHLNGTALKFVQLEKKGEAISILGYSNVPLPKNLIANDTILDAGALAKLIQQSLIRPQFGRISTNRVVVSVPESKSFIRVIHIPEMSEAQAENAVLFEAEAYIPLPMDQVYFDWQILRRQEGKMEVLIIASPKEFVDKYLAALEKINLKLVGVEVESQSVVRTLMAPGSTEDNTLIADLDAYKTALIMVVRGNLQFTSSIPIAGNSFTERIAQALTVPVAKAEAIKREFGLANTQEYPNLKTYLLPVVNDLAAEIKNILKFHYDHSEQKITKLLLSGGSAKVKHLDEFLGPMLTDFPELKVEIANPLVNLNHLGSAASLTPYEALSFTTAIGLALRNL
jgi:type IV pilus assembly protein PilM